MSPFSPSNVNVCDFFSLPKACRGIAAWKYYPIKNLFEPRDYAQLVNVTYNKQRQDTILRVAFHSTLGEHYAHGCSQWYIQFDGKPCTSPASINSLAYTSERKMDSWLIAPAEVNGFCRATSAGPITFGNVTISVHVAPCSTALPSDAHTGSPQPYVNSTSSIVVEEYCWSFLVCRQQFAIATWVYFFKLTSSLPLSVNKVFSYPCHEGMICPTHPWSSFFFFIVSRNRLLVASCQTTCSLERPIGLQNYRKNDSLTTISWVTDTKPKNASNLNRCHVFLDRKIYCIPTENKRVLYSVCVFQGNRFIFFCN